MTPFRNKKPLWHIRKQILIMRLTLEILEIAVLIYSIKIRSILPFKTAGVIYLIFLGCLERYYYRYTAHICPHCNRQFKPQFWKFLLAPETPRHHEFLLAPETPRHHGRFYFVITTIWELLQLHKPHARRLTCPSCGKKSYCFETDAVSGGE